MPKFIMVVMEDAELIEAKDQTEAEDIAFETWLERVDRDYYVEPATKENLANWELEDEGDAA